MLNYPFNVKPQSAAGLFFSFLKGGDGKVGWSVGGLKPAGRILPHNYQFSSNDSRGGAAVQLALAANDH